MLSTTHISDLSRFLSEHIEHLWESESILHSEQYFISLRNLIMELLFNLSTFSAGCLKRCNAAQSTFSPDSGQRGKFFVALPKEARKIRFLPFESVIVSLYYKNLLHLAQIRIQARESLPAHNLLLVSSIIILVPYLQVWHLLIAYLPSYCL